MTRKKSVDEARTFYAEAMRKIKRPEYKQGFRFLAPRADQGDPEREALASR